MNDERGGEGEGGGGGWGVRLTSRSLLGSLLASTLAVVASICSIRVVKKLGWQNFGVYATVVKRLA